MPTEAATFCEATSSPRLRRGRAGIVVAIVIGLVAIAVAIWKVDLEDRLIAKRWGVVEEGAIYRSGQLSRHLVKPMLEQHGIRVVVDLTEGDRSDEDQRAERWTIAELGIEAYRFPLIGDGTGDIRQYAAAVAAIAAAKRDGKPVLVHCHAGAQRTGGVIAAYRLLVERTRSPSDVFAELPRFGWQRGRDDVLLAYLNSHLEELAKLLVERGVIDEVPSPLPRLVR